VKHPLSRSGVQAVLANAFTGRVALSAAIACGVFAPGLAQAQTSTLTGPVSGWSSGVPSYVAMYEYVPKKLAASPPVLVAAHYCGGTAQQMSTFQAMPTIEQAADTYGFVMIFPQTNNSAPSSKECWDVGSTQSLTHNGGGDTQAIAEMVQYEVTKRNANPNRVYIMGASSGAMLTEAMCAVYPDVFKAGSEFSGVPAGCWHVGWTAASNWSGSCADEPPGAGVTMTAAAWGSLAHAMYPSWTGAYPRMQLWHGTADTTINFVNEQQGILQWTDLLGLSATPNTTTMPSGFTVETWQNSCGYTVLEAHEQQGGGHTTPIDATSVIDFFGLNNTGATDPQVTACGGSSGTGGTSGTGSGGTSGSAGTTGGSAGHGGTSGGTAGTGGHAGTTGGGSAGTVGTTTGGGGHAGTEGGAAGTTGEGVAGTTGGGTAGTFGGGSAGTVGTTTGTGGHAEAGTSGTGTGGHSEAGTSGTSAGGTTGSAGSSGGSDSSSGCSCEVASGPGGTGALYALALAAFGMALGRRPRRRR
jgi:acetylxylan esterase